MERLTEKGVCGNWSLKGLEWKNLHTGTLITGETCEVLYGALCKLLTCEETRLTTEEIEMRTYCTMGTPCEFQRQENMNGKDTDVPAKDGWIPVEERMPEEKEKSFKDANSRQNIKNLEEMIEEFNRGRKGEQG